MADPPDHPKRITFSDFDFYNPPVPRHLDAPQAHSRPLVPRAKTLLPHEKFDQLMHKSPIPPALWTQAIWREMNNYQPALSFTSTRPHNHSALSLPPITATPLPAEPKDGEVINKSDESAVSQQLWAESAQTARYASEISGNTSDESRAKRRRTGDSPARFPAAQEDQAMEDLDQDQEDRQDKETLQGLEDIPAGGLEEEPRRVSETLQLSETDPAGSPGPSTRHTKQPRRNLRARVGGKPRIRSPRTTNSSADGSKEPANRHVHTVESAPTTRRREIQSTPKKIATFEVAIVKIVGKPQTSDQLTSVKENSPSLTNIDSGHVPEGQIKIPVGITEKSSEEDAKAVGSKKTSATRSPPRKHHRRRNSTTDVHVGASPPAVDKKRTFGDKGLGSEETSPSENDPSSRRNSISLHNRAPKTSPQIQTKKSDASVKDTRRRSTRNQREGVEGSPEFNMQASSDHGLEVPVTRNIETPTQSKAKEARPRRRNTLHSEVIDTTPNQPRLNELKEGSREKTKEEHEYAARQLAFCGRMIPDDVLAATGSSWDSGVRHSRRKTMHNQTPLRQIPQQPPKSAPPQYDGNPLLFSRPGKPKKADNQAEETVEGSNLEEGLAGEVQTKEVSVGMGSPVTSHKSVRVAGKQPDVVEERVPSRTSRGRAKGTGRAASLKTTDRNLNSDVQPRDIYDFSDADD